MSEFNIAAALQRAEIEIEAENLMARHCYYHAACWNSDEIDNIWVTKDEDVVWAQGHGKRTSLAKFRAAYGDGSEQNCRENAKWLLKEFPEIEGRDVRPLLELAMHTLTTPVIEVAQDMESAKGWWYTPGSLSSNLNYGGMKEGNWLWERYGADFTRENGQWKLHRAVVFADLMAQMDAGTWVSAAPPQAPPPETDDGPQTLRFPHDTQGDFHHNYAPTQTPQDTPPQPVPYRIMAETFKYNGECK